MGRLTDDMTRLVGEIHAGRDERGQLMRNLGQATAEMKQAVARMQAGFRSDQADMSRRQRRMLRGFVSGLRAKVAGLQTGVANDLAGAHQAWNGMAGAMPGRRWRSGRSARNEKV